MDLPRATKKVAFALVLILAVLMTVVGLTQPASATTTLPNGTAFKGASSPQVYVIENGGYYTVPNPETFNTCVGTDANIRRLSDAVSADVRATYPFMGIKSCRVSYPSRTTLVAPASPKVYVILGSRRYWVTDANLLGQCLGGDAAIRRISNAEMMWSAVNYPYGGAYSSCPPTYPDGTTLVAPSSPRVYVITGGKKYWVDNAQTLDRCLGGDPAIRRISDAQMTRSDENYAYNGVYSCPTPQPPSGPPASARNIGYNPFAARYSNQCTYFAEQRMAERTGRFMPVYGNAYQWPAQARAGGWTVGTAATVNSVVAFPAGSFGSSVGHVAWVISINGNSLYIQDYNWNWVGAVMTQHWVTIQPGTQFIYSDR